MSVLEAANSRPLPPKAFWVAALAVVAGLGAASAAWLPGEPLALALSLLSQVVVLAAWPRLLGSAWPRQGSLRPVVHAALAYAILAGASWARPWLPPLVLAALTAIAVLAAALAWRAAWTPSKSRPGLPVVTSARLALVLAWAATLLMGREGTLLAAASGLAWGATFAALALSHIHAPDGRTEAVRPASWREYLALTKPVIVTLLLVTTLAGMVVGAGRWPGTAVVAWTMLGGALSAGGASALNQYSDRNLDRRMQRTQHRPFPAGRIGEAEGLAFAVTLCIAGFFTLALAVNPLSAWLSLAGMLYYVVLYSLVLKQSTTHNIVVGGGAGAIPPLVGWAAATGSLSMAAFFLFAVIFFWTPPHFWALALLRRKDYARAGVPMLPVVESERSTAWQILLYTVQLVALTLLLPLAGVGGLGFTLVATAFGAGFIAFAWRLWRLGGNRLAYGLYRYSSMYLALLFVAMVVDTLARA